MTGMSWIKPEWPAPTAVAALCTTRVGGVSEAPYAGFNLAGHVGDDAAAVTANRERLNGACSGLGAVSWLTQVHGARVVEADGANAPEADAQYTDTQGLGCAVLTADCLPVLFCNRAGTEVAAAHAGWRGLGAGVLEATVAALDSPPGELLAWLGPAIGPASFEVGAEVQEALMAAVPTDDLDEAAACFARATRPGHFFADLYQLARLRLRALGLSNCYGGGFCTRAEPDRFYSYRRDRVTGRMASLIYLVPDEDERW